MLINTDKTSGNTVYEYASFSPKKNVYNMLHWILFIMITIIRNEKENDMK